MDYRNRYYSPGLRRFIEPDPIGFEGGMNLYAYVGNDPVNAIDPWGLWGLGDIIKPLTKYGTKEAVSPLINKYVDSPQGQRIIVKGIVGAAVGLVTGSIGGAAAGAALTGPLAGIGAEPGAIIGGLSGIPSGLATGLLYGVASEMLGIPDRLDQLKANFDDNPCK